MQYQQVTGAAVPSGTEFAAMVDVPQYRGLDRSQLLLAEIRDKLCDGNAARLARAINKDATYVNRLFYPEGKPGRKGIGLSVMQATSRALFLPQGFWDREPPALSDHEVQVIKTWISNRNATAHGETGLHFPGWRRAGETYTGPILIPHTAEEFAGDFEIPAFVRKEGSALKPIRAWEYEDDLPEGEFVMVPRLDVKLSAGPGSGASQLELDFDDSQLRAYSADWIRRHHLKPNKLRIMKGSGRSMEPTIFDGDDLLINLAETEIVDAKVYALWYEGGERVKRLYRMPGGGLRIRSDNAADHPEIVLGPDYIGHIRIIGRVIDRSGPGGL